MSLRANVVANFVGQAWRALMQLAFLPVYVRFLGLEGMGLIGIFAILQASLVLLDFGIRPTLAREMSLLVGGATSKERARDLLRSAEWLLAGAALLLAAGVWLASGWLARSWVQAQTLDPRTVQAALVAMGAIAALRLLENAYTSVLAGLQLQVMENAIGATLATVRAVGAVAVLAWYSATPEAFFGWQALVSAVSIAVLGATVWRQLAGRERAPRFSLEALAGCRRFAGGMLLISALALLLTQVDKILLSRMLPLESFGHYALAGTLAGVLYLLTGPVATAYFPRLTELAANGQGDALRRTYHSGAQIVSVGAGTAAVLMLVFSERLLWVWTGDAALSAVVGPLLRVLALGTLLNVVMWMPYQLQLAHGWTRLAAGVNLVAVVVLVPAIVWAVPRHGAIGAAWAWVALNTGYVIVSVHLMHRRLLPDAKWPWYWRDLVAPIGCAVTICLAAGVVWPVGLGRIPEAAVLGLTGGLACAAALLVLRAAGGLPRAGLP